MKPSGADGLRGTCPIHKGDDPKQFSVSISKNCWNCFSDCQCGGNILDFVAKMENVTIHEAALLIAEWFHLDLPARSDRKPDAAPEQSEAPTEASTVGNGVGGSLSEDQSTPTSAEPRSPVPTQDEPEVGENKPLGFELKGLETDHPYFAEPSYVTA